MIGVKVANFNTTAFQNQRIVSSHSLNDRNQRTVSLGYCNNLKELAVLMKEPMVLFVVICLFFNQSSEVI
jgi:hypothetical protein